MLLNHNECSYKTEKVPLRLLLVVPFVIQIFAAVGLVGYLSFKNGQKAVNNLADRLIDKASQQIDAHLDAFLTIPQQLNQMNADALASGEFDFADPEAGAQYFWRQAKAFENISYLGYTLPNGKEVGSGRWINGKDLLVYENLSDDGAAFDYLADGQGRRAKLLQTYDFDPRLQQAYQAALKAKEPIWADIFTFETNALQVSEAGKALETEDKASDIGLNYYVAAPARYPVYSQDGKLLGTLVVDMLLSGISDFLQSLKISPSGQVFIIERNGLLIGSSGNRPIMSKGNGKTERLNALDSPDPLIQTIAQHIQKQFSSFQGIQANQELKLTINGQRQFVQVTPWQDRYGLDWLVVVSVPESDFMEQINANTRTTILLCVTALALATLLGMYTSKWITQPILKLSQASKAIANGQLDQKVTPPKMRELSVLAQSFNYMADQLRQSFKTLEQANEQLEQRVEERTLELKIAKEEAEAAKVSADMANQAKSEFLANMSHELRTPLNGILGYVQILQTANLNEKERKGIGVIHQCGFHLLTLINDILDLSKIEARKLELHLGEIHFPAFLQGVFEICRIKADQKGIAFNYQADSELPVGIQVDEKRLRQVLINLLGNAIKFTDSGTVTFRVTSQRLQPYSGQTQPRYKIRFEVEDTGIGMTPEQLEKIFLPFEQVGDVTRQVEGTGLGLTISQKIVSMMGSVLEVRSRAGQGSVFGFELELPEAGGWAKAASVTKQGTIIGYRGSPQKILVVDDRWENRSILVSLLESLGFGVAEADNGQIGLAQAAMFHPDLIITDLLMPVMDGFEFLKQLRESESLSQIPVIVSSASVFESDQYKSIEVGANGFLPKPVQFEMLLDQLKTHLPLQWIYAEQTCGFDSNSSQN